MWTKMMTSLLVVLASWMSLCRCLPTVDPGLFVIMGVRTCRLGQGYCLLGVDCTLDEDFLPDDEGGHCDGLRSAFTPSAHFICCRYNPQDNITTPADTTEPDNTTTSLALEPRTHPEGVPAQTAPTMGPPEMSLFQQQLAPYGQTLLHYVLPRDVESPRNEADESQDSYVDETHSMDENEIHSENHTTFRPARNNTSLSTLVANNTTENSVTDGPTETAGVISTKASNLGNYTTVVEEVVPEENETKITSSTNAVTSAAGPLGSPTIGISPSTVGISPSTIGSTPSTISISPSTIGSSPTNTVAESTPYSPTSNEHDITTQTSDTSSTDIATELTITPGGTEATTVSGTATTGQSVGVPPATEVTAGTQSTTETSATTQQPGCSGDQDNLCWDVMFQDRRDNETVCHGTFISADTVLTSAKCVIRLFSRGLEEVKLQGDAARISSARIKDVLVHEDYDIEGPMAVLNDLGMVRLHPGEDLLPECALCLPHVEEDFMGQHCCSPATPSLGQPEGRLLDGQAYTECGPGASTNTSRSADDVQAGAEMAGSALLCGSVLAGVASMTEAGAIFTPTTDHLSWIRANMA